MGVLNFSGHGETSPRDRAILMTRTGAERAPRLNSLCRVFSEDRRVVHEDVDDMLTMRISGSDQRFDASKASSLGAGMELVLDFEGEVLPPLECASLAVYANSSTHKNSLLRSYSEAERESEHPMCTLPSPYSDRFGASQGAKPATSCPEPEPSDDAAAAAHTNAALDEDGAGAELPSFSCSEQEEQRGSGMCTELESGMFARLALQALEEVSQDSDALTSPCVWTPGVNTARAAAARAKEQGDAFARPAPESIPTMKRGAEPQPERMAASPTPSEPAAAGSAAAAPPSAAPSATASLPAPRHIATSSIMLGRASTFPPFATPAAGALPMPHRTPQRASANKAYASTSHTASLWERVLHVGRNTCNTTLRGSSMKKKRVVKRDPNQAGPKAWSADEMKLFRELIVKEGVGSWKQKAAKLGTGRSAKALHTRWLREEGRIIDKPRGRAAQQQQAIQALIDSQLNASAAAAAWNAAAQQQLQGGGMLMPNVFHPSAHTSMTQMFRPR